MQTNTRVFFLDGLKGLGCLLMIMAHMPFKIGFYKHLTFIGSFAPILFYAVAGITATFQIKKRQKSFVVLNYFVLFLLGFTLNGFNSPDFLRPPVIHFDMIQIIALCSLIVYLLELYLKPSAWIYLLLGILSFLIKLGLDVVMPAQDHPLLAGILLTHVGTFPVFPWLFLFFLGVFAYRTSISQNLGWAISSLSVYFILEFAGFSLDYRSKYDMSVGYFLLSSSLLFVLFALTRKIMSIYQPSPNNLLIFLGQNSLLFLFVHFAIINILSGRLQLENNIRLFKLYPFLLWFLILISTLVVMIILDQIARFRVVEVQFNSIWVWVLLTALVFIIPAVVLHEGLVRWAEIGFGITAGLYYHHLGAALARDQ